MLSEKNYEKTGFKECPLLERCKTVSGMNCLGRDFLKCDFLICTLRMEFPAFKRVPEKYRRIFLKFWPGTCRFS
jgi:hypothetical protein